MALRIIDIPVLERPRERLIVEGVDSLSERELLALILRNGTRGTSAIDLAATTLGCFGNLASLSSSHYDEIIQVKGIGSAKAAAIVAAFQLARRVDRSTSVVKVLSSDDLIKATKPFLVDRLRERVVVVICDVGNNIKHTQVVSEGAIDQSLLPIREILHLVLRKDGRSFAIAHNHPSGNPKPSKSDVEGTQKLSEAAKAVGLTFLDHVVVAGEDWLSIPFY